MTFISYAKERDSQLQDLLKAEETLKNPTMVYDIEMDALGPFNDHLLYLALKPA